MAMATQFFYGSFCFSLFLFHLFIKPLERSSRLNALRLLRDNVSPHFFIELPIDRRDMLDGVGYRSR